MKACIVQPAYSTDHAASDAYFEAEMAFFDACDPSMDLIVFPEACDCPCLAHTNEQFLESVQRYNERLLAKAADTARRCAAVVFVSGYDTSYPGYRNTTFAFDKSGTLVGKYFKEHLTPGESSKRHLDDAYTFAPSAPTVLTIDGVRYAFLTCYDFYFYENFARIAREHVDVIIGCSHQRSDTHQSLEIMTRFLAYNTNAYVVRASVSMDVNATIGGASMIVSPDGTVLANLKSEIGMTTATFDPHDKYYKPAGFGGALAAHYEYIEAGRRPWKYRPAGSAIVHHDALMAYPRVCAHRGFSTVAPENSMPAFGAAVALGAEEIEFDLWWTKDGEIVSIHDSKLDRVSTGTGRIYEHTLAELEELDFGSKHSARFAGLKIVKFEDILKKFSCHTVMNIHLKTPTNAYDYDPATLQKLIDLIDKYDCRRYVYFMSGNDKLLQLAGEMAPDIARCCGGGDAPWEIVERALRYGCKKVQLFKPYFNKAMIDKAHANGIRCNVFWSDDAEETKKFLDMGIDTILTNDYHTIAEVVKAHKNKEIS